MRLRTLSILAWLFSAAVMIVALRFGQHIHFAKQWPLYEALRATAAIIFAVVGAWLAIIYPERLRLSFANEDLKAESGNRFSTLFTPIVNSTAVLCIVLLVGIVAPVLKQFHWAIIHISAMRALSFLLLTGLTFWQLWTVVLTLVPADVLKSAADHQLSKQASLSSLRGLGSSITRPKEGDEDSDS